MDSTSELERIRALPLWQGDVTIAPLTGGLTNLNYIVSDQSGKYVVRIGEDIPVHHVMRFNELAASYAAHDAGLSPKVIYAEKGVMVIDFITANTLAAKDIQSNAMLDRIVPLLRKCHCDVPNHLRGPVLMFWVFHVIRDYGATLRGQGSSHKTVLPELLEIAEKLETASGPFDIVFCHNDLLAANFLDDGKRLWLIDWDYAGFNSPLFDLGGLASNNALSDAQERYMLELYFDGPVDDAVFHRYHAMKCASLLRETMWSMVSEITSSLDEDYAAYTAQNLKRFRQVHADFLNS